MDDEKVKIDGNGLKEALFGDKLTGADLRVIRKATGRRSRVFGTVIGVADERSVRRYEAGGREMSGTLQRLLNYLVQGLIIEGVGNPLPPYFICIGPEGEKYIQRNRYPRFISRVMERTHNFRRHQLGAIHWIDDPVDHDQNKLLAEAIDYYTENHS